MNEYRQQDLFQDGSLSTGTKKTVRVRPRSIWEGLPTIFLSLGAGIQSSVLLMHAIQGKIDRPDHVLFADTGWEPRAVYLHLAWLRNQCRQVDIPFHIVRAKSPAQNIRLDALNPQRTATGNTRWDGRMPVFASGKNGKGVPIRRQCTQEYKIIPLRKKQRELMGYSSKQRIPLHRCLTMIGFSTDEARRAGSSSKDLWNENIFPLISDLRLSRLDCQSWWEKHYPDRSLQKSACIGCPFRSDQEWLEMKRKHPDEFEDACLFDEQIRYLGGENIRSSTYLHRSLQSLRSVDFNDSQENLNLGDQLLCSGGCGI